MSMRSNLRNLARELRRSVRAAEAAAKSGRGGRVRVAGRTNVRTAVNIGSPGSAEHASATQYAPIRQVGGDDRS